MVVEIVTAREVDVPTVADADIAAYVQRLRELVGIAHTLLVECSLLVLAHRNAITECQRPRHIEAHVTVGIGFGNASTALFGCMLALFHRVVHIRLYLRIGSVVVLFFPVRRILAATKPFLYLVWRKREREVLRHALEAWQTTVPPLGMIAHKRLSVRI